MRPLNNDRSLSAKPISFSIEPLEARQFLSAVPWSAQDQLIGLDQATQNYPSLTGAGETVAIIDRGVDYNHANLGGGFGPGFKIVAGYNFQDNNGDVFPYDNDGHGTGTAGQIAANPHVVDGQLYQGVAPGVNIVALKTNGAADLKGALDWIIGHRKQYNIVAINYLDKTNADQNALVPELQALTNAGVFIGGPVGNYGPSPAYQSANHLIHLVGSVDLNGQISNFTPRGSAVDLVAPGGGVNITWYDSGAPQDATSNGTSWSAPQVVGTAALIKQINPKFTPAQILSILQDSAQPVWDPISSMTYGELNVNAALGLAYQRAGSAGRVVSAPIPVTSIAPVAAAPTPTPVVSTPTYPNPGTPFTGTPFSTGHTIQAKYFDAGGDGVSYHTPSIWNAAGDTYRPGTVDFTATRPGGRASSLGWTQPTEWLNYTLQVSRAGTYDLTTRVASLGQGGVFHFEVDGIDATGAMTIPDTHGWNQFVNVIHRGVSLNAGSHVVRLVIDQAGAGGFAGNFNSFKFTAVKSHAARHRTVSVVAHAAIVRVKKQFALPGAFTRKPS